MRDRVVPAAPPARRFAAGLGFASVIVGTFAPLLLLPDRTWAAEAELKVYVTERPSQPLYLRVAAAGAPPTGSARLQDAGGLNEATVTFPPAGCGSQELRHTGLGTEEWCLRVEGLGAGSESTGRIETAAATLKLTVGLRHPLWPWPVLTTLGSILVGLLVAWVTTDVLPEWISRRRVDREISDNEWAGSRKIEGLRAWVGLQGQGTPYKTLRPLVTRLCRFAPMQAGQARDRLGGAIGAAELPGGIKLLEAARAEAQKKEHSITDFYHRDGTKTARHPADEWIVTLERAHRLHRQLHWAGTTIGELKSETLKALLDHTAHVFRGVADASGLDFAEETARDLWRRIHDAIGSAPPRLADEATRTDWSGPALPPAAVGPAISERLTPLVEAGWATFLATLAIIAVAALSAASASYFPKQTFGTFADYVALFVSGFGSSSIAGILGTLLLWKRSTTA
jgi:hypothetical protein